MKTMKKILIAMFVFAVIWGCSNKQNTQGTSSQTNEEIVSGEESKYMVAAEPPGREVDYQTFGTSGSGDKNVSTGNAVQKQDYSEIISSGAARGSNIRTDRKIIRTADVKFRVADVAQSTYGIEKAVQSQGGWIESSHLWTEQLLTKTIRISEDSSMVISKFVVRNTITVRTPADKLDTTLQLLVPFIEYLDSRVISTQDVTFDLLAQQLKQKRLAAYQTRMQKHLQSNTSKLSDVTEAERQILLQQERADEAYIEEMKLFDRIEYSSMTIEIYEKEKYEQFIIPNIKDVKEYQPSFGMRFIRAIQFGWNIIQEIILIIVSLWGVIFIGLGIYFLVRYLIRRFSKKK